MKIKIASIVCVRKVEHRVAKQWLRGAGKDAVFQDKSEGFFAIFQEWPGSAYLGDENPGLVEGDYVKITLEKIRVQTDESGRVREIKS